MSIYIEILNWKFTVGNIYDSISRILVLLFVMISKRYMLSIDKNMEYKFQSRKT